jgi:hypothetical protein
MPRKQARLLDWRTAVKENATACRGVFFFGGLTVELL